ncbi:probable LRR receptor-like serine/threonine-protein kinase At4g37250, partial [Cynara cardunculus var. scolymus]|uniref:probable LRR receptor-like serine/threonine-protein kinase At4g37250 n=1 Tax=Cynara cardunculus var. scolymus TaxID=59895 RepID=UPI000D628B65
FFFFFISSISALNSDGILLLSFKYSVLSDPFSVLDNWNYDDLTPCSWQGVTCEPTLQFDSNVVSLVLPDSHLLGSIPQDLGMLPHLRSLDLSNNSLNGTLPPSIFNSSVLESLSLSSNVISGELPELISGLHSLKVLNLSDNAFAGKLPEALASMNNLTAVSLKNNYFSGSIPGGFDHVEVLDLSFNLFNETLPLDFGGERLRYLNLSNNKLSGSVSPEFAGKIQAIATIDLSFNNLTGEIPQLLSLSNQKTEFFAGNLDLCGKPLDRMCTIPSSLSTPPNVTANGSASAAIAAIPKNIDSSPSSVNTPGTSAMADNHGGPKVKPAKIAAIVAGDLAGIGLLAILFLYAYKLRKKRMNQNQNPTTKIEESKISKDTTSTRPLSTTFSCLNGVTGDESSETATGSDSDHENDNLTIDVKQKCLVMVDGETELEIETLLKASAYVLGSSGSSIVYKAVLGGGSGGGGMAFAVRRIGDSGVERMREFENTIRIMAKLRHPNLLRVRGFYWGEDEKLVIYDYVSNGSLAGAGYKKVGSSPCQIPFEVRLKIAKGVAMGLAYIHEKKHVHGNIKPSNILLTSEMDPVISDFGLEWLISGKHNYKTKGSNRHFGSKRSISSREEMMIHHDYHHSASSSPYMAPATGLLGCTSPYHAPESMKSLKLNPKWDVYSFGIVLLELISGKVFSERELGLWNTASSDIEDENSILKLVDMSIRSDIDGRRDATLACFKLGFSCASLNPQKRPSMKEALQVLEKIPCSSFQ